VPLAKGGGGGGGGGCLPSNSFLCAFLCGFFAVFETSRVSAAGFSGVNSSPPWPWWVPGGTIHQVGWSREARSGGARVRFPWPALAHVRFGWATSRLSGGTILRGCARGLSPTRARAHPLNAGQSQGPYFLATLKQSWQEDTDQKFAPAASRQVGAYVRGMRGKGVFDTVPSNGNPKN
jgi:hypothetical protein